jgi:hypothetical protein
LTVAGNRKFESISLQERVHCELDHRRLDRPPKLLGDQWRWPVEDKIGEGFGKGRHRKDGIATKAPTRPAAWQSPKPEARALVGNTSEMKICEEFPASWDGEDHPESDRQHHPLAPRIGPEQPEYGGQEKGGHGGGFAAEALHSRPPHGIHAVSRRRLAVAGRQKIEFSDLAIGKPRSTRMFGSQAPSPSAMPKKAKKQIIPAITRAGYSRRTVLRRVFRGVGEAQRLLGAKADTGKEPKYKKPTYAQRVALGIACRAGLQRRERHRAQPHALQQVHCCISLSASRSQTFRVDRH